MSSQSNTNATEQKIWFKQFWPWFLIILPACVIIASTTTAVIAFRTADSLVMDNSYREGLAINQYLEQDHLASTLKLHAKISLDHESGEIRAVLNNPAIEDAALRIEFLHARNQHEDIAIVLNRTPKNDWLGHLPKDLIGQWYVRLTNTTPNQSNPTTWRLQDTVFLGIADKASSNLEMIILKAEK